jgi:hypothetical protein
VHDQQIFTPVSKEMKSSHWHLIRYEHALQVAGNKNQFFKSFALEDSTVRLAFDSVLIALELMP